jgi:hypothetical protein
MPARRIIAVAANRIFTMRMHLALALAAAGVAMGASAQGLSSVAADARAILAREPTAEEIATLGRETREAAVIRRLVEATETQSVQAPIVRLYMSCLGRVPDYEGFDYYAGVLADSRQTLDDMADEIATSPEFEQRYGSLDNRAFVELLYRNVFGRAPEPGAAQYWATQLDGGASRAYLLLRLSESPENIFARERVVDQYIAAARLLHRAPGMLDPRIGLEDYVAAVLSSPDAAAR